MKKIKQLFKMQLFESKQIIREIVYKKDFITECYFRFFIIIKKLFKTIATVRSMKIPPFERKGGVFLLVFVI